ncbi:YFR017C-like protein [Saccharomyces cerevisiae x Saccharomyces kudriavzevii VIN7]|uniref:YFR017C-like protein n=1 Tax=Saccharomyces cerevisiae x Saccharomyces kudriavzevii (strain VIN7) TaxID=1095631 RepID=H0GUC1_SACCK|nr:YFR017C-like protein [Saccharomyces cerevisiae x Saccharomyces kudriavzevii VIN7]
MDVTYICMDGGPLLVFKHVKLVIDVLFEVLVLERRLPPRSQLRSRIAWDTRTVATVAVKVRVLEDRFVTGAGTDGRVRDGVAHVHAYVAQIGIVSGPVLHAVDGILEIHGSAAPTLSSRGVFFGATFALPGLFSGIQRVHVVGGAPSHHGGRLVHILSGSGSARAREIERGNAGRFLCGRRFVDVEEVLRLCKTGGRAHPGRV